MLDQIISQTLPLLTGQDTGPWISDGRVMVAAGMAALGYGAMRGLQKLGDAKAQTLVEQVIVSGRTAMDRITASLVHGKETIGGWFARMARSVLGRNAAGAIALTKTVDLDEPELDTLAVAGGVQLAFLKRFRDGLRNRVVAITDAIRSRAASYADAAWATAHAVQHTRMVEHGMTEARRILELGARHCFQCPYLAGLGWVEIDYIVPIGSTPCRSRCHCSIVYR